MREVLDAISNSIPRTGCPWQYLSGDFPPKSSVWRDFDRGRKDGTLETIHDQLRRWVRTAEKPQQPRTTASLDSPSVVATSGREHRGFDRLRGQPISRVRKIFADAKYHNHPLS